MASTGAKLTRRETKARSRERLIGATIRILGREGAAGLTTGKVAHAAGLSQPSFYVHFKDMDDALEAAAETIGLRIRRTLSDERRRLRGERSHALLSAVFRAALEAFLAEPMYTEVFLKHRRDDCTPVGRHAQELLVGLRTDLLTDCREMGLTEERLPHLELFAEYVLAMVLSTVEGVLDGRLADRTLCVEALLRSTVSVYGALESIGGAPRARPSES